MAPDKLKPNDPRVSHHTTVLNGKAYHYLLGNPSSGAPKATIMLVHGFPDLSLTWRYQIPVLTSLGLRVIAPDMPGYGGTDAPEDLAAYSYKSMSADLMELAKQVTGSETEQIILGGHDWGGILVWRVALWYPSRIRAVFSICSPYAPPTEKWFPLEQVVQLLPNLRYQLHLAGPEVEAAVVGRERISQFLNGMYGGGTPEREFLFDASKGVRLDIIDKVGPSPLLDREEMDFYVDQYVKKGTLRGPLNWYRTREINYGDELELVKERGKGSTRIRCPSLFIAASKDTALPPAMSKGMEAHFDDLTKKEVNANHFAHEEKPEAVNEHIVKFLEGVLGLDAFKASI